MRKKILITGIAGFIGTNLYLEIQSLFPDWEIIGVDNFSSGSIFNLKQFKGDFHALDLRDTDFIYRFQNVKFDYVFHIAANSSTTDYDPLSQTTNNIESFRNVLTLAAFHQTPVIWTSSASVYGKRNDSTLFHPDDELRPDSPYAISKKLCENLMREVVEKISLKIIGVRPLNVYGKYEDHKNKMASMVSQLLAKMQKDEPPTIFRDGLQCRDFIYVKDLVSLLIGLAVTDASSGIYNGGTGQAISFLEVINSINRVLNKNLQPNFIENPHSHYQAFTQADISKTKNIWTPKYSLDEALQEMVNLT